MDRAKRAARVAMIIRLFQRAHQHSSLPMSVAQMDMVAESLNNAINSVLDAERAEAFADAERIFHETIDKMHGVRRG